MAHPSAEAFVEFIVLDEQKIPEATLSAANGILIPNVDGEMERDPFFEIERVVHTRHEDVGVVGLSGEVVANRVKIDPEEGWIDVRDFVMFHAEINDMTDEMRHTGMSMIQPQVEVPQHGEIPESVLVGRAESSRRQADLERNVRSMLSPDGVFSKIIESFGQGTDRVFVKGRGGQLSDFSEFERGLAGPRNKTVGELAVHARLAE